MNASNLYAIDAELSYRQERARGSVRRLTRRQRKHERYCVVHPAGDARA
jgi:hypothetical protein